MKFYLAPMEGITGHIYRNTHAEYFGKMDKYITPFIAAGEHRSYKSRELKEVLPENNRGLNVTVQILTNNADSFISTARRLQEFGYAEVNLNLGCPSKTVVTKGKGAGFLAFPKQLDRFLCRIFEALSESGMKISVKTRLGLNDPEEFYGLLDIFFQYPLSELIIHSRVQSQFYGGRPDWSAFWRALEKYGMDGGGAGSGMEKGGTAQGTKIIYNGDIFTKADYEDFVLRFPKSEAVMTGRGVLVNPGLVRYVKTKKALKKDILWAFYKELSGRYLEEMKNERNVMYKLKELWFYMVKLFACNEEYIQLIKRAGSIMELDIAVKRLIKERDIDMDKELFEGGAKLWK